MDNEMQQEVPSDFMVATKSDSNLSSVNTNPGSYLLAKVTAIANQVSVKIRQKYPDCFRLLPIVVIQCDEVTMVNDKPFNVSNEPSSSSIQPNNDLTNCFKRPLLNESLNIKNIKKCRLAENIIEGQLNISNLKSDLHNDEYKNVKIEMNKNVKNKVSVDGDAFYSETFDSFKQINHSLMENSNLNQMIQSNPVDTTNEIPITVIGNGMSKSKTEFPIFELFDNKTKGELIQGMKNIGEMYHPKLKEILKDSLTFEEFEKRVDENISRLMDKDFDKQLKICTDNFIHSKNIFLQEKFDSMKLQLSQINAVIDQHGKDLTTDINAIPQKVISDRAVQTKIFKSKEPNSFGQCSSKKQLIQAPKPIISDESTSEENAQGIQTPNIYNPPIEFVNLPLPENAEPIPKESNINLPDVHIDNPLPSSSSMPILPLPAKPIQKSNINVSVQHNIAPLPSIPNQKRLSSWKPLPPAPKLKILNNQTSEDIALIWNMEISGIEKIKSFEVYCYNEVYPDMPTSVDTWQKVGDVNFIPLPIKCILKKGTRNIKCHYIVRAVDVHDCVGPFSLPESVFIS